MSHLGSFMTSEKTPKIRISPNPKEENIIGVSWRLEDPSWNLRDNIRVLIDFLHLALLQFGFLIERTRFMVLDSPSLLPLS